MVTGNETKPQGHTLAVALLTFAVVCLVYVLSIGPSFWVLNRMGYSEPAMDVFRVMYYPISWMETNRQVSTAIEWYLDLWVHNPGCGGAGGGWGQPGWPTASAGRIGLPERTGSALAQLLAQSG